MSPSRKFDSETRAVRSGWTRTGCVRLDFRRSQEHECLIDAVHDEEPSDRSAADPRYRDDQRRRPMTRSLFPLPVRRNILSSNGQNTFNTRAFQDPFEAFAANCRDIFCRTLVARAT
jgi:hypothetical protein